MAPDSHLQNQGIGSLDPPTVYNFYFYNAKILDCRRVLANQWLSFHTEKKESFRFR